MTFEEILSAIKNNSIENVDFLNNNTRQNRDEASIVVNDIGLGPDEAKALAASFINNHSVISINLNGSMIGSDGACYLAKALLGKTNLTSINLAGNFIGPNGAKALADTFASNPLISYIDISYNEIGFEGIIDIIESLENNSVIFHLDISGNTDYSLTDSQLAIDAPEAVARILGDKSSINYIGYKDNHIEKKGAVAFAKDFENNFFIQTIDLGTDLRESYESKRLFDIVTRNKKLVSLEKFQPKLVQEIVDLEFLLATKDALALSQVQRNGASLLCKNIQQSIYEYLNFHELTILLNQMKVEIIAKNTIKIKEAARAYRDLQIQDDIISDYEEFKNSVGKREESSYDDSSYSNSYSSSYSDSSNVILTYNKTSKAPILRMIDQINNLTCYDVAKDGNCFFSAVAHQISINPNLSSELLANNQINSHSDLRKIAFTNWQARLEEDEDLSSFNEGESWDKNGVWAVHTSIDSLSRALNLNIIILRSDGDVNIFGDYENRPTITLGYVVGLHYQSMVPASIISFNYHGAARAEENSQDSILHADILTTATYDAAIVRSNSAVDSSNNSKAFNTISITEVLAAAIAANNNIVAHLQKTSIHTIISEIVKADPTRASEAFEVVNDILYHYKQAHEKLKYAAINALPEIVKAMPENAKYAIKAIKDIITDRQASEGLKFAVVDIIFKIVKVAPESVNYAFKVIKDIIVNKGLNECLQGMVTKTILNIVVAVPESANEALKFMKPILAEYSTHYILNPFNSILKEAILEILKAMPKSEALNACQAIIADEEANLHLKYIADKYISEHDVEIFGDCCCVQ